MNVNSELEFAPPMRTLWLPSVPFMAQIVWLLAGQVVCAGCMSRVAVNGHTVENDMEAY